MNAPRVVAAIIALSALGMGGCKSGNTPASTPAKPAAAKPSDAKAAPAAKASEKPTPAPAAKAEEKPAPTPAPTAKADEKAAPAAGAKPADDRLTPLAKDRQVLKEKREQLVQSYTEMGDKAYAESRFEEAETAYGNVLDLDPKNEHAQRRLEEVGAILGKSAQTERTAFRDAVETTQVRIQQAKVEVANLAAQAQSKAKTGDYDAAVAMYDKALVIAGLYPANVDFSPSVEGLKTLRDGARKSADKAEEVRRGKTLKEAGDQAAVEAARQRAARRERLQTLFKKANQAMERNDYQTARNLAEEILKSEPQSEDAKRLRRIAVDASSAAMDETYHRQLLDEWKHVFEELSEAYMPQVDDYTFPKTWEEIQKNRTAPVLSTAKNLQEDPQNREVRNKLDGTRTTVQFHNVTLTDAADYLHRIANVNIIILQNAKEGKSDADLTIEALQFDQPVQVSQILNFVTDVKGLAWNIENGVVQITTKQAAQGAMVVQLYDVKDLATPVSNFPGDEINLDPKGEHAAKEEPKEPVAAFVLDNIGELITNNVDKTVWEGGGSVEPVPPGTLVVKCPATTHVKVQQLLDGLRGAGGLQVSIETRFITVQDNFLQEVGADLRGLGDQTGGLGVPGRGGVAGPGGVITPVTFDDVFFGSPGTPAGGGTGNDTGVFYSIHKGRGDDVRARFENLYDVALGKPGVLTNSGGLSFQGTYLDKTQVEVILRAVEKNDRATLVTAPRLTAFNGQRANVTILNQQSYISDFDVEIAQASQIGDPIVQVIRDGTILDLRPVVSSDRRFITMELRPTIAVLTRPIATFQTTLANGPPVTIQLPELAVQRVRTTVTVPDGGTLLLGGLKFLQEQRLDSTVPFMDKIPIASFFFSRKGTYLEKRNVLILIRARILRPEENEPGSAHKL
jgi:Flp pilus assembly secretin CpaC/predicted TPR repeat methyltransferase